MSLLLDSHALLWWLEGTTLRQEVVDRMLIAQAAVEGLTIVTHDPAFDAYEVDVLRA